MRGVAMSLRGASELPEPRFTPDQTEAIGLFLRRLRETNRSLLKAGVPVSSFSSDHTNPLSVLAVSQVQPAWDVLDAVMQSGERISDRVLKRYSPYCINLQPLATLARETRRRPPGWPGRRVFLVALLLRALLDFVHLNRSTWNSLRAYGYLSIETDLLIEEMSGVYDAVVQRLQPLAVAQGAPPDVTSLIAELQTLPKSITPLYPGALVRQDGDLSLVDVRAASGALGLHLDYPSQQGDVANWRSEQFELAVRDVINRSAWAPDAELIRINGRTLRLAGAKLTDIDAIGSKGDALLLISAKSRVLTIADEDAKFEAVRNASTAVIAACREAVRFEAILRQQPIGDNFDFSRFTRLSVVVCTPYPIFVPGGLATDEIYPGMARVMCLDELAGFLET